MRYIAGESELQSHDALFSLMIAIANQHILLVLLRDNVDRFDQRAKE